MNTREEREPAAWLPRRLFQAEGIANAKSLRLDMLGVFAVQGGLCGWSRAYGRKVVEIRLEKYWQIQRGFEDYWKSWMLLGVIWESSGVF